jgi:DNA polymerase-3 subunit beta
MEIKLQAKELAKKLEQVSKVVPSNSVIPILKNVLVETRGDVALITASDSEMWLSVKCELLENSQDLRLCVNANDMLSLIKNLGDRQITITIDEESSSITCGYESGKFTIPYDNADEFPKANMNGDDLHSIIMDSSKLLNAIEMTRFAAADSDKLMPSLNGVHIDFSKEGMVSVATNKQKAAMFKDKEVSLETEEKVGFTVPKKVASVLSAVLETVDGDVKLSFNDAAIHVNNRDFKLSARLIEYKYPKYDMLFVTNRMCTATINKDMLSLALKRVTPASNEMSNLVMFKFSNGCVTLSTESVEFGKSASETVTCDCDGDMSIGFKGSSVMDVLRNLDDEDIVIELSGEQRPAAFYTVFSHSREEFMVVCTPMILNPLAK